MTRVRAWMTAAILTIAGWNLHALAIVLARFGDEAHMPASVALETVTGRLRTVQRLLDVVEVTLDRQQRR